MIYTKGSVNMENTKKRPVKRIGVITFDDQEDCDKLESGERHSNKGIRDKKKRFTNQPDIKLISDEEFQEIINGFLAAQEKKQLPKQEDSVLKILGNAVKEGFLEAIYYELLELRDNPQKRAIVLTRANKLWVNKLMPAGRNLVEKAKFAKEVIHAVRTDEQPKILQILEEDNKTEIIEAVPEETAEEQVFIEVTEEQKKKIAFAVTLLVDTLKKIKESNNQNGQLTKEDEDRLLTEEVTKAVQFLLGNDFELNKDIEKYIFEQVEREMEKIPLPIQE